MQTYEQRLREDHAFAASEAMRLQAKIAKAQRWWEQSSQNEVLCKILFL